MARSSPVLLSKVLLYSCLKKSPPVLLSKKSPPVLLSKKKFSCLNPYSRPPRKFRERPSNFCEWPEKLQVTSYI